MDLRRSGVSLATSLVGGIGVLLLVVTMNRLEKQREPPAQKREVTFDVPEKRKAPPTRKPRPKPRPKPTPRTPPPPIPEISQAIGGVDVGLWAGSMADLSDGASSLLGEASNVVMTAETVDSLPEPTQTAAAPYPPNARNRGVEGYVTLRLDFDARGGLTQVSVADSQPLGVFDQAAVQSIRMWRFSPATFQGRAVPVSGVEIKIEFNLERAN